MRFKSENLLKSIEILSNKNKKSSHGNQIYSQGFISLTKYYTNISQILNPGTRLTTIRPIMNVI